VVQLVSLGDSGGEREVWSRGDNCRNPVRPVRIELAIPLTQL